MCARPPHHARRPTTHSTTGRTQGGDGRAPRCQGRAPRRQGQPRRRQLLGPAAADRQARQTRPDGARNRLIIKSRKVRSDR
eukprot:867019-Prymnesium_polylepis.1